MQKSSHPQFTSHDRMFYSEGYQLAQGAISKGLTESGLFEAIRTLYQSIDSVIESLLSLARKQNIQVDCGKGCEWCCHQAVFANSYEMHYLSAHIKTNFAEEDINLTMQKSVEKRSKTSTLNDDEVLKFKSPCPLLADGACSAYPARPMACRIYLSTSLPSCLKFFNDPDDENGFPELMDFPLRAGRMMNEGFSAALKEAGIATTEFRMEDGLSIALKANHPLL